MKKVEIIKEKQSKSEMNKLKKKKRLYDSAYELFTTKGINDTAINDIVKGAGVAKGTFYLYFKDKYHIIDLIVLRKSSKVLKEAIEVSMNKEFEEFNDKVIFFVDYIIEYLREDKKLLRLIYKNLSWGIYRKVIAEPLEYNEMKEIAKVFMDNIVSETMCISQAEKILFMIIELTGSVCYSSIILEEPDTIDNMKPVLFKTIKKILQN
ncbi:TetR/AcrR family transcriptional regulator [Clostridium sp. CF011]|uniref:TetR/AcrR family transcriptional regulator n=1 Tax=unclassified Clostridium TaxID=2614128 RepID=UPI001C0BC289|nr:MULTISPECIES: TetR/AcrR family transcriptional regulator [unclassified Clostridium]MBU3091305.1 TetR/AcrR family transcriptional regulator [Clostridium sp. CF011]MBW9146816.1 TetR/AcrR family transcriptional regulator [Clostridium sp. CM027]UVE39705.1 TetR/AcrR family transcriptional regulator [Clostridium sp. CM027]WAG68613.1 TetR/AcrR family transcriptional regulator [Clostridium sp. CF011]